MWDETGTRQCRGGPGSPEMMRDHRRSDLGAGVWGGAVPRFAIHSSDVGERAMDVQPRRGGVHGVEEQARTPLKKFGCAASCEK